MHKRKNNAVIKYAMTAAVIACIAVLILSAFAASAMYIPSRDQFTSSLGENLTVLCRSGGYSLSETQLDIIKNADILTIRYENDSDGNRLFSAKLRLYAPQANAGAYSDNPLAYLTETKEKLCISSEAEDVEIIGICNDNLPVVDIQTLESIAEAAERIWARETLSADTNFEYALTDYLIPEPYSGRKYAEGASFRPEYEKWLDQCAEQFASEGLTVYKNGVQSGTASDIREAMANAVTPYLCSVRNIALARSEKNSGIYTLSFDSLDIINTVYSAKKPTFSALNKLAGVYSEERVLKVSIDIDLSTVISEKEKMNLAFFNLIRAITKYGSTIGSSTVKIKTPDTSQVIAGQSDGQWPVEFKRAKGDGNVIVNVIRIKDSGEETSVVKLFLTDGGKITVCLSKGRYRINTAVGATYYGNEELFGENGIYMCDKETVYDVPSNETKSVTVAKHPGESLRFTDYQLGQFTDSTLIDRSRF
ncbi:MAG: hypothetical protein IJM51_11750 [Clostridia bacterium]|nr:hypothetical protein [Clostridia bacterium]